MFLDNIQIDLHYQAAAAMAVLGANVVPWFTKFRRIIDFNYFECLEFFEHPFLLY